MSPEPDENSRPEENLVEPITEYQEELSPSDREELEAMLEKLLASHTYNSIRSLSQDVANGVIADMNAGMVEDILYLASGIDDDLVNFFMERGVDKEFMDFIKNLRREYFPKLQSISARGRVGNEWWSNVSTNVQLNEEAEISLNTKMTIDKDRKIEYDSTLSNSVSLATHFVQRTRNTVELYGELAVGQLEAEEVSILREELKILIEELNKYKEDSKEREDIKEGNKGSNN
jgi:hypothetical protein